MMLQIGHKKWWRHSRSYIVLVGLQYALYYVHVYIITISPYVCISPSRQVFCDIQFPRRYIAPTFFLHPLSPPPPGLFARAQRSELIPICPLLPCWLPFSIPMIAVRVETVHRSLPSMVRKRQHVCPAQHSIPICVSLRKNFFPLFFISIWVTTRIAVKGTSFWYNQDRMSDPGRAKGGIRTVWRVRPGEYVRYYAWLCDAALHWVFPIPCV